MYLLSDYSSRAIYDFSCNCAIFESLIILELLEYANGISKLLNYILHLYVISHTHIPSLFVYLN